MDAEQETRYLAIALFFKHHLFTGNENLHNEAKQFIESLPPRGSTNVEKAAAFIYDALVRIMPCGYTDTEINNIASELFDPVTIDRAIDRLLQIPAIRPTAIGSGKKYFALSVD